MSNPQSFTTISDADARHMAEQTPRSPWTNGATIGHRGGTHSVTVSDGAVTVANKAKQAVVASPKLPPGFVRLVDGSVSSLGAVEAAGLGNMIREYGDDPVRGPARNEKLFGDVQRQQASDAMGGGNDADSGNDASTLDLSPGDRAAVEQAAATLSEANQTHGQHVVGTLVDDLIVSGDLTNVPEGTDQAQLQSVITGFTAQANAVLRSTGASVDMLNEFLSTAELAEARRATYLNDDRALRELGGKAISRLSKLPENDPAAFKEMTAAFGPNVQITSKDGETWIKGPSLNMSWARAVRTGRVHF